MDAHAVGAPASNGRAWGPVTVLSIIGASVLAGVGLLGMAYWLLTLRWLYFASVIPLVLGAYLMFTRATGTDHA